MKSLMIAVLLAVAAPAAAAQEDHDVPFVITPDNVTLAMLRLAGVRRGDHVIDLGSGDGRIVITAARRFGASGLGVEIVPELVARSRAAADRAGVGGRARFVEQDLFATDLAAASVITMYLLPEVNLQLRPKLLALAPGTRIVSHDWDLGDWPPDQTHTVPAPGKPVGREKLSRLHLWRVPAPVAGRWCGSPGVQLRLEQRHQQASGPLASGSLQWAATGRLEGALLRLEGAKGAALQAHWRDGRLRVIAARGPWRALRGQQLRTASGERCD